MSTYATPLFMRINNCAHQLKKVMIIFSSFAFPNKIVAPWPVAALLAFGLFSSACSFAISQPQVKAPEVSETADTLQNEFLKLRESVERISRVYEADVASRDGKKADEIAARNLIAQEAAVKWAESNVLVASLALLFSAGGLIALLASLHLNRQAVKAANSAVVVARESNAAQSRAWVSINCKLGPPNRSKTHLGVEGTYFEVTATAHNHGNSPATSVSFHAEIALLGPKSGTSHERMTEYTNQIRMRADNEAEAIFPGSTAEVGHMVFLPLSDIEESMNGKEFKMISPVVYGCLNYKSPHVDGVRQTRFAYHLASVNEFGQPVVIQPDQAGWLEKSILLVGPGTVVSD